MKNHFYLLFLFIAAVFFSCDDDDGADVHPPVPPINWHVLVLNEGAFSAGNASVFVYDTVAKEMYPEVYRFKNGVGLGDVAQSITRVGNTAYAVINASNKIEAFDLETFMSTGTINGLGSPRMMAEAGAGKAYVTDIFSPAIHIVNLNTMVKTGEIATSGYTEGIVRHGGHVYAGRRTLGSIGEYIYKIDIATDAIIDSIQAPKDPARLVVDKDANLWAYCAGGDGDFNNTDTAWLVKIDLSTFSTEETINLGVASYNVALEMNETKDQLYFINNHLYTLPISATAAPSAPLVAAQGTEIFYGLGVDARNHIYVGVAPDYSSLAKLHIYNAQGNKMEELAVGILPNDIMFK